METGQTLPEPRSVSPPPPTTRLKSSASPPTASAPRQAAGRLSNLMVMRRYADLTLFTRYAVAWIYLVGVSAGEIVYTALPSHDQAALLAWASTNVHNLQHDPAGSLIASAFFPTEPAIWWPGLIALALFGANKVLGNWRTAAVCAAGHVIGTLVSEGILEYRVTHHALPAADRYILDVGPSYVVVAAIAVAIMYGSWLARAAAAADLALLTFVGDIFGGLSSLRVAAVGHVTAIAVGVIAGGLAVWQRRRAQAAGRGPAGAAAGQEPTVAAAGQEPTVAAGAAGGEGAAEGSRAADQAAQPRPPA